MENKNMITDLKSLRLSYLAENLNSFISGCDSEKMKAEAIIRKIVELEIVEKSQRGAERRVRQAKLGRFRRVSEFDWNWPDKIDRNKLEKMLKCDFISQKRNVILAGPQGLGKTMFAKNIGHLAAVSGKTVLFTSASNMVMNLKAQSSPADINRILKKYVSPELLILDELGYLSYDCQAADLIFEIINRRYENSSIVISTNLAFKDWNSIFPGAACLTAMIDRLTHHVEIVKFDGKSYRLKESIDGA